jgi:glycosyltransferase involved in cell wall biosynthesis
MADEVIILSRSLPFHHLGGMEVVAWDLAVELQKREFKVTVITTDYTDNSSNPESLPSVKKIKNIPPGVYSKGWWEKTDEVMQNWQGKEDVCAVISISAGGFAALKYKKVFPNASFIMQAHGTSMGELVSKIKTGKVKKIISSIKNIKGFLTDAKYYRGFDRIVAVGDAVYRDLTSFPTNRICDVSKVLKIENGIDQNLFTDNLSKRQYIRDSLNITEKTMVFISASRLHEQKGVDRNISIFEYIHKKEPDSKYLICGDGPYESELRGLAEKKSLKNDIHFLGAKTRTELAELLQCADVFLFLTKRIEGLPLNILEAMSAGIPLIISDHLHFCESDHIHKHCMSNDANQSTLDFILKARNMKRKSFIPQQNTLRYCVDKYISLFK